MFIFAVSEILERQSSGVYTAYIVEKRTGYLMANSVGDDIYDITTESFILAISSPHEVIKQSYSYLINNDLSYGGDVTTTYVDASSDQTSDMRIKFQTVSDFTKSNSIDVVYVSLSLFSTSSDGSTQEEIESSILITICVVSTLIVIGLAIFLVSKFAKGNYKFNIFSATRNDKMSPVSDFDETTSVSNVLQIGKMAPEEN